MSKKKKIAIIGNTGIVKSLAYELAKNTNEFDLKRLSTLNMSISEELKNNLPLALSYRKEYEKWNDSLNDQNKVWEVAEIEKEFAVKQKQKEVNILAAENKLKVAERNKLLYAAVGLLLLLLIIIINSNNYYHHSYYYYYY